MLASCQSTNWDYGSNQCGDSANLRQGTCISWMIYCFWILFQINRVQMLVNINFIIVDSHTKPNHGKYHCKEFKISLLIVKSIIISLHLSHWFLKLTTVLKLLFWRFSETKKFWNLRFIKKSKFRKATSFQAKSILFHAGTCTTLFIFGIDGTSIPCLFTKTTLVLLQVWMYLTAIASHIARLYSLNVSHILIRITWNSINLIFHIKFSNNLDVS